MMAMTRAVKIALCGSEDSESIAARQDRGLPLYNFLTDVQDILNPPEYHWCYRDLSCETLPPGRLTTLVSCQRNFAVIFVVVFTIFGEGATSAWSLST